MNKERLMSQFEKMTPEEAQKARMWKQMQNRVQASSHTRPSRRRRLWITIPAACLVLALALVMTSPFGGGDATVYAINVKVGEDGAVFKLADSGERPENYGTSVSEIDSRPDLEFYIDGDNIAKIEIEAENEYLYAVDWTKTQKEKYWNSDYYQHFDEERQISIANFDLLYDKKMTMTFDDNFRDYGKIWYRWTAWDMYKWAAADNFAHFLGAGLKPEPGKEHELAAGSGSGIGHIQLEGYPEHLTKDRIKITITDRQGKIITKYINIKVSNNEVGQTVVTASLEK